jgi:hypothetical protein
VAFALAPWEILSVGRVLFVLPTNVLTDSACMTFLRSWRRHLKEIEVAAGSRHGSWAKDAVVQQHAPKGAVLERESSRNF